MMHTAPTDVSQGSSATQSTRKASRHHKVKQENQRVVHSDNDAVPPSQGDVTPGKKARNRKRTPSVAQKGNGVQSDRGESVSFQGPQAKIKSERADHTPVKAFKDSAYAGATFQQSPAASALPMPTLFSRSMPNNSPMSALAEQSSQTTAAESSRVDGVPEKRESIPLDYLFSAARQARDMPSGFAVSPARFLSPAVQSPAAGRSPAERAGVEFPFELEGEDEAAATANSTPFSQRIAQALPRSTPGGGQMLSEQERIAKSKALKEALRSSSQSLNVSGSSADQANPFNAQDVPPLPASNVMPSRHISNPSTPFYEHDKPPAGRYDFPAMPPQSPNRNNMNQYNQGNGYNSYNSYNNYPPLNYSDRPTLSGLRNTYYPSNPAPLPSPPTQVPERSTSVAQSPAPAKNLNFAAIYGGSRPTSSSSNLDGQTEHKPSIDQGIEDLRKALNMPGLLQR